MIVRRLLLLLAVITILSPLARGQAGGTTFVSATVKDPNGNLYTNSQVSITFKDPGTSGKLPLLNGSTFQTSYSIYASDSFAHFSIALPDNQVIASSSGATGTKWHFNICYNDRVTCFAGDLVIDCLDGIPATCTSGAMDISLSLQALPSAFLPLSNFQSISTTNINNSGNIINGGNIQTGTLNVLTSLTLAGNTVTGIQGTDPLLLSAGTFTGGTGTPICKDGLGGATTLGCIFPGGTVSSFSAGNANPFFTTSVANPTTTPALTFNLNNQNANCIFSGPASGVPASPTCRSLVGLDLPNPSTSTLGGIQAVVAVAHNWVSSISNLGVPSLTQPTVADISGLNTTLISLGSNSSVCSTTSTAGSTCTTTVTISPTQPNTNFIPICMGTGAVQFPFILGTTTQTTSSITVEITNGQGNQAQVSTFATLSCIAVHP